MGTFEEKSLWILFAGVLIAFGFYFSKVLPTDTINVNPAHIGLFIAAIVILVVVQIIGHIIAAIADRNFASDERDRLYSLKAVRTSSYVLAAGVFISLCVSLITEGNFVFTHVLLGFWVLATLAEIGHQLYLYRRGC